MERSNGDSELRNSFVGTGAYDILEAAVTRFKNAELAQLGHQLIEQCDETQASMYE